VALRRQDGHTATIFGLFAYSAETARATVASNPASLDPDRRPDLTCVLDPCFLPPAAGRCSSLQDPAMTTPYGVTLLHKTNSHSRHRHHDRRKDAISDTHTTGVDDPPSR
jgi:hypothetical protein